MMKYKHWCSISVCVVVFIGGIWGCSGPHLPAEPLPAAYKSYQPLNAHYNGDDFKVKLLVHTEPYFPYPIHAFENGHGQLIVEANRVRNQTILGDDYYKLNKDGDVIDSLFLVSEGGLHREFIGDFSVFVPYDEPSYYTTWPLNGDTLKKEIEILNGDFSWTEERLNQTTAEILATAKYTFYDLSYPRKKPTDENCNKQLFFFKNNKWQVLYHKYEQSVYLGDEETISHLREDIYRTSDDEQVNAVQNFTLKYFEQKKYIDYGHAIGGGQAGSSSSGWEGTAYFDVPLGNGVLKIKQEHLIIEKPTPAIPETHYYNSHGDGENVSNFALNFFTHFNYNFGLYATDKDRLYIIKRKQTQ